ncbi:MAG: AAA family ATPase [Anaerolineae bacterium]|nr:AAA family ATPase [Anaerolineae bacterium]MDK1117960.1 AAA family ATPase [Anaerolineae bacterium]
MEKKDSERHEMVQFHQSYSYDDFVRGYRPDPESPGKLVEKDGIFHKYCEKARTDPERKYVFIIDEINRGNLSQIIGELLMLIENDKRGAEFAVPLVYRNPDEQRFFITSNVYLIGLMNTADLSLAMVDYALRRRFAFFTLTPQYESKRFHEWLTEREMDDPLVNRITTKMSALNREITWDTLFCANYQVGDSYFCPKENNFSGLKLDWYLSIIETEIAPLLKEYWFDNTQKANDSIKQLLS